MAKVGLRYPVFAQIKNETPNAPIEYKAGVVFGRAINATVNFNRSTTAQYSDDAKNESDNSVTGGNVTFTVDQVTTEGLNEAFGYNVEKDENGDITYDITDEATPYGGFGFIISLRYKGENVYRAMWIYKMQFAMQEITAETKGETVKYQPESAKGDVMAVRIDETGKQYFIKVYETKNEAKAWTWLKTQAGLPESTSMPA